MDKEFYAAEVFKLLQRRCVPFVVPAVNTARKGGGNGWLFKPTCAEGWYSYSWVAPLRRMDFKANKRRKRGTLAVTVRMCVARGQKRGKEVSLVYATWGLDREWKPARVVAAYRRRFGIEVSYRQLGQGLARTSSRDERYRLLLVGVALLLSNVWAYLHSEVFATGPTSERRLRLSALRLPDLLVAVATHIAETLGGYVGDWPIQGQLPQELAAWQTYRIVQPVRRVKRGCEKGPAGLAQRKERTNTSPKSPPGGLFGA
jgi:hypothetical protein